MPKSRLQVKDLCVKLCGLEGLVNHCLGISFPNQVALYSIPMTSNQTLTLLRLLKYIVMFFSYPLDHIIKTEQVVSPFFPTKHCIWEGLKR